MRRFHCRIRDISLYFSRSVCACPPDPQPSAATISLGTGVVEKKRHFALLYLSICRRSIAEEFKDAIRRFVCWCTFPRGLNQGPGKCIQDQRATTSERILLVGSFTLPFDNRTLIPPFIVFLFWRRGVTLAVVFFLPAYVVD